MFFFVSDFMGLSLRLRLRRYVFRHEPSFQPIDKEDMAAVGSDFQHGYSMATIDQRRCG